MSAFSVEQFLPIVNEYKNGKLSQSEALNKLEKEYGSAISEYKKKMTNILKKNRFYQYVPCSADELISAYDKVHTTIIEDILENYLSELESKAHAERNKFILSGQPLPEEYRYKWEVFTDTDRNLARITIYDEQKKIAELSQEKRKITEYYEKSMTEIMSIEKTSANIQTSEIIPKEKMLPRFQKMFADKIITGEKINGRWVVNNEKHGIKELMEWAEKNNETFPTPYIMRTFCKQDGKPFTRGSINTGRHMHGFT
jgi:hypothetical protein